MHGETITSSSTFHSDDLLELCTALTALKSVEMKVLSLSTDINRHLLYWKVPVAKKTRIRKVTLQNLLQHTSGIEGDHFATAYVAHVPGQAQAPHPVEYDIVRLALVDSYKEAFPEVIRKLLFLPLSMRLSSCDTNRFITTAYDISSLLISFEKGLAGKKGGICHAKLAQKCVASDRPIACFPGYTSDGSKRKKGGWFVAGGPRAWLFGHPSGRGIVLLSDGIDDPFPLFQAVARHQGWDKASVI